MTVPKAGSEPIATSSLDNSAFTRLFKEIYKSKREKRRFAKRTMTPTMLKKQLDLLTLGKRADGKPFSSDDLKEFDNVRRQHRKEFDSMERGIPFSMLVVKSRDIDIKRANNQVFDGRGITDARIIRMKNDTATFRVKASSVSKHSEHVVEIRMEEWGDELQESTGTNAGLKKSVKNAAKGRITVGCDCKRFQFWYRYVATQGKYCLPPLEYSYPKFRNTNLEGTACKHILKAAQKLQSPTVHNWLAGRMSEQIGKTGYADDSKRVRQFVSKGEEKKLKGARSNLIHLDKLAKEYEHYQVAKERMRGVSKDKAKISADLKRVRRKAERLEQDNERLSRALSKLKNKEKERKKKALDKNNEIQSERGVKRLMGEKDKALQVEWGNFKGVAKLLGTSEKKALQAFAKKKGLTMDALKDLI